MPRAVSVGDKVPADVRLCEFQTATLRTDEAALTGESETVLKTTDALPAAEPIKPDVAALVAERTADDDLAGGDQEALLAAERGAAARCGARAAPLLLALAGGFGCYFALLAPDAWRLLGPALDGAFSS